MGRREEEAAAAWFDRPVCCYYDTWSCAAAEVSVALSEAPGCGDGDEPLAPTFDTPYGPPPRCIEDPCEAPAC